MRRTREVTIVQKEGERENRDANKTFLLTEVSAVAAEEWGVRAIMALGSSGITVPQEMVDGGLIGAVLVFYQAFMGANEAAIMPLWREMLPACVKHKQAEGIVMPYHAPMIEEVGTILTLRQQIMELHTGFTLADLARQFKEATIARQLLNSQTTSTSPASSEQ